MIRHALQTETRPNAADWRLAHSVDEALRVDRVAGLTADRLAIAMPEADAAGAALDAIAAGLDELREPVSDTLFSLVPLLEHDRDLRRTALGARRQTQKPQPKPIAQGDLDALSARLRDADLDPAPLLEWARLLDARAALEADHDAAFTRELAAATGTLEALRADDEFLTAVADASPALAAAPGKSALTPSRHTTRSILAYAGRSALKPSPFGRLTRVGYAQGTTSPDAEIAEISHSYAAAWLDVIARDEYGCVALEVEPLDTGGLDARTEPIAVANLTETPDFVWRRTAEVQLRGEADLLDWLRGLGRVPVADLLDAIGGERPFDTYLHLLGAGFVRPVAPWAAGDREALATLSARLEAAVPMHPIAAELRVILDDTRTMLRTTGRARGRVRAELQREAERALASRGVGKGRRRFEVYLDVAPREVARPLPPALVPELDAIAEQLTPRARTGAYRIVVDDFVRRYGRGGTAPSLWEWLVRAAFDDGLQQRFASGEASAPDMLTRALPRGASMPRPSAVLAFQVADGDEPRAVINQVLPGQGGLVTRFARLHDGADGLATGLRERAEALAAPALPFEVVPSADVNGMQAAAAGTLPLLVWPTERPVAAYPDDAVRADALSARHDVASDSIVLTDATGAVRAPLYLGLVPAHLGDGPERMLSVLADPWHRPRVGLPTFPVLGDATEIRQFARRESGRVVLRRAAWTVPTAQLPEHEADPATLLRTFGAWRREQGLPDEVFVRVVRQQLRLGSTARKPVWVDLRSAHALEHLYSLVDDDTAGLEFTEALPASGEHPRGGDGRRRAVEHLVFVDWQEGAAT
ncbi:lantibiotic dehydratase [Gulosibacter faecalis]|uniref:Lantibiotic dehydratase n=1 Tax=Gulosibacter faecalis TaxID=272240 RepID=A0ABW5UUJ8_9MICO|nr:lantibiotic dehydratase [Gulosibacter faecalis]